MILALSPSRAHFKAVFILFLAVIPGLVAEAQARKRSRPEQEVSQQSRTLTGRVVKVSDGDTVTVLEEREGDKTQVKVRLDGIDAPEKSQPFGETCRKSLAAKVAGKEISVRVRKLDRYGRSIGNIEANGGGSVNLQQVKEGCAWFYRQYAREHERSERELYEAAESKARAEKIGLWKDKEPEAPWEYRRKNRGKKRGKRGAAVDDQDSVE